MSLLYCIIIFYEDTDPRSSLHPLLLLIRLTYDLTLFMKILILVVLFILSSYSSDQPMALPSSLPLNLTTCASIAVLDTWEE